MVAGEFRVDAGVVDEDIAKGSREDGNANKKLDWLKSVIARCPA